MQPQFNSVAQAASVGQTENLWEDFSDLPGVLEAVWPALSHSGSPPAATVRPAERGSGRYTQDRLCQGRAMCAPRRSCLQMRGPNGQMGLQWAGAGTENHI